jgi:hypothetical protein
MALKDLSNLVKTVTILDTATNSNSIDISKYTLVGIEFPAAMTGTGLTLQVSQDDSTFVTVYQGSGDVTIAKQNSKLVLIGSTLKTLEGLGKYLRVSSSGAEGADRTFKLYLVPRG